MGLRTRDLRKFGIHGKATLKTDQEPAIRDLALAICKLRGEERTLEELALVGDSRGNGIAERSVQAVEEMIRVHKLALERRLGNKVPVSHKIFNWLVEHCADILNRFQVGKDGKTAYFRLKGKRCRTQMVEFGRKVMFRVCGKVQGSLMQERWYEGIWLGKRLGSEENLVMTSNGKVVRSRAVREQSSVVKIEDLDKLISTPHDPTGTFTSSKHGLPDLGRPIVDAGPADQEEIRTTNRAYITNEVVEKFEPTNGCKKCKGIMDKDRNCRFVAHTSACRARMEEKMKEDDSFRRRMEEPDDRKAQNIYQKFERRVAATRSKEEEKPEDQQGKKRERDPRESVAVDGDGDVVLQEPEGETPTPGSSSSGIARDNTGTEIDDKDADDMGIPLATQENVPEPVLGDKREAGNLPEEDIASSKTQRIDAVTDDGSVYDVSELFSPPRTTAMAQQFGFKPGFSFDDKHIVNSFVRPAITSFGSKCFPVVSSHLFS